MPIDGNNMHDSKRSSSALSSYCPLASRIFGSCRVGFWLGLLYLNSLVLSRLLYLVHLWNDRPKPFRNLNAVYMRALRRIAGQCRFSSSKQCADYEVRIQLGQPSLDCLFARLRLLHLTALEKSRTMVLHALLATRCKGARLPWVTLALQDLCRMYEHASSYAILYEIFVCICTSTNAQLALPGTYLCPGTCECAATWRSLVLHSRWADAVGAFFFTHSQHDRSLQGSSDVSRHAFVCVECSTFCPESKHVFDSQRALDSHSRSKHGVRTDIRAYIGDTSVCPACSTKFSCRVGLITHLSDKRRQKCPARVREVCARISEETLSQLDEADKVSRREAQRLGYSRPIASVPACKV